MKTFILFISCLMVFDEVVESKDGYLLDENDCTFTCSSDEYCVNLCKIFEADSGFCNSFTEHCYCKGLPSDIKVSGEDDSTCEQEH
uniref:NaTx n=1 Tax=Centruroides hentzi TaxID=88313 RepID=A0A2I9LPA1_9SCOR